MAKPIPVPTTDTAAFWQACNREELLYQKCDDCGHVQFYPRRACAACHGSAVSWLRSAGHGTVHSFTVVHRPANRNFDGDVPYVVALIDMAEGYRMMMNVIGDDRLSAAIGRPVRIVFEARSVDQKIPQAVLQASP
jgi:uncharacterized OB-fold protein